KARIATATVGVGSSNQGDFHEGVNLASVQKLPFVCVIISNKYGMSVPDSLQYAAEKLSDRALGYGVHGEELDGNDALAMYKAMKEARGRAISGQGSTLIEAVTSRMTAHSSDDDDQCRTKEGRETLKKADCNEKFKKELVSAGIIDDAWLAEIEAEDKD
ncbi:thiamine pyrophosphate-dependent enzyme, partial [Staphylococcus aureus]